MESTTDTIKSDRKARERAFLEDMLSLTVDSQNHGQAALENLQAQEEVLEGIEDTLESNEILLQKANRSLRGMTLSGKIYNMFTADPSTSTNKNNTHDISENNNNDSKPYQNHDSKNANITLNSTLMSNSNGENELSPIDEMNNNYNDNKHENLMKTTTINTNNASKRSASIEEVDENERALEEVLKGVQTLTQMSVDLGQKINKHQDMLNNIENKADDTEHSTLGVTLRTAQFMQRSTQSPEKYIGCYQFYHTATGRYLNVMEDDLVLDHKKERTSYFHVYKRDENLMALQSVMTRKYLGMTWLGEVRMSGDYFGQSEQLNLKLADGGETGIFLLACNWWVGGWLRTPTSDDVWKACTVTSSMADRKDALKLQVKLIDVNDKNNNVDKK